MRFGRNNAISVGALIAAVLVAYANGLNGVFQFDDYQVIVDNAVVHSWQAFAADFGPGIRPLLKLSYLVNWLSGLGEIGFHATNLLFHLGNATLLLLLTRCFLAPHFPQKTAESLSLLAALLFAVHPVHTEAVTYICGRSSSLMTLFYLAGLYVHVAPGPTSDFRTWRLVAVPLLFVSAIASKETAVTFPIALLLWDLFNGSSGRQLIRRQWTTWLVALILAALLISHPQYRAMLINCAGLHSLQTNILTTVYSFFYLLGKWLLPIHLNIDPDLPLVTSVMEILPQLLALILLASGAWLLGQRRPWLGLAFCWLILHLIPLYLLVPRQDIANERQLYLAGAPLFIAGAAEMFLWLRTGWKVAATGLLLLLTLLTIGRNSDYRTEISLWEQTVTLSPGKARPRNNLGYAYMLARRYADAEREYRAALAIDPEFILARNNLAALPKP